MSNVNTLKSYYTGRGADIAEVTGEFFVGGKNSFIQMLYKLCLYLMILFQTLMGETDF